MGAATWSSSCGSCRTARPDAAAVGGRQGAPRRSAAAAGARPAGSTTGRALKKREAKVSFDLRPTPANGPKASGNPRLGMGSRYAPGRGHALVSGPSACPQDVGSPTSGIATISSARSVVKSLLRVVSLGSSSEHRRVTRQLHLRPGHGSTAARRPVTWDRPPSRLRGRRACTPRLTPG